MAKKWESARLYEHPVKHQAGTFGRVVLHDSGVYSLMVGYSSMSCPQDWAAKVHHEEGDPDEIKYLLNVDADTWSKVKVICARRRIKIKDALTEMIQKFISD